MNITRRDVVNGYFCFYSCWHWPVLSYTKRHFIKPVTIPEQLARIHAKFGIAPEKLASEPENLHEGAQAVYNSLVLYYESTGDWLKDHPGALDTAKRLGKARALPE